jgi:hypothetical protein
MASKDLGSCGFQHFGVSHCFFYGGKYSKFGGDGYGKVFMKYVDCSNGYVIALKIRTRMMRTHSSHESTPTHPSESSHSAPSVRYPEGTQDLYQRHHNDLVQRVRS